MAEMERLTEKQKEFCRYCAEGMEPRDAAKKLGYVSRGMWKKLMEMEKIQKYIEVLQKQALERTAEEHAVAEKKEILRFLTEMMREDQDPKMRMKAAELLGKRESLFERPMPEEGKSRIVIVDDIP